MEADCFGGATRKELATRPGGGKREQRLYFRIGAEGVLLQEDTPPPEGIGVLATGALQGVASSVICGEAPAAAQAPVGGAATTEAELFAVSTDRGAQLAPHWLSLSLSPPTWLARSYWAAHGGTSADTHAARLRSAMSGLAAMGTALRRGPMALAASVGEKVRRAVLCTRGRAVGSSVTRAPEREQLWLRASQPARRWHPARRPALEPTLKESREGNE